MRCEPIVLNIFLGSSKTLTPRTVELLTRLIRGIQESSPSQDACDTDRTPEEESKTPGSFALSSQGPDSSSPSSTPASIITTRAEAARRAVEALEKEAAMNTSTGDETSPANLGENDVIIHRGLGGPT